MKLSIHIRLEVPCLAPVLQPLGRGARLFLLWLRAPRTPLAPADLVLAHALRHANLETPR